MVYQIHVWNFPTSPNIYLLSRILLIFKYPHPQVSEKILGSCTDLMGSVRELIISSAALQKEIVVGSQVIFNLIF